MTVNIYLPVIFIIVGFLLRKYPPKYGDFLLGYKSPFYMKNKDAWYEGNRFFGKILMYGGISGGILYILIPKGLIPQNSFPVAYVLIAFISIVCTEVHLYRIFKNKFH